MEEQELKRKVLHYNTYAYKRLFYKTKLRDRIYYSIKKEMENYVISILNKWEVREQPSEIVAYGWDAFLFCLERVDRYDKKYKIHQQ